MHRSLAIALAILLTAAPVITPAPADAGGVLIPGALGTLEVRVDSLRTMRFREVVPQQYDYSCGSAALATLLSYHYARPTSETETFDGMFQVGDQALIREQGFSMLDMKQYLAREHGLASDGFRLGLDDLAQLGVPAIAMIETEGYRHFVVLKGLRANQVLVGDPALGVQRYSHREFETVWSNDILFIIRDELAQAQAGFNALSAWQAVTRAPVESGLTRQGLGDLLLHLPHSQQW